MPILLATLLITPSLSMAEAAQEPQAAAKAHFERGVTAFNERRFAEAAKEFQAAYDLTHTFVVLYNIGLVNAALGQAVESVDAFQTYLDQGGSTIPEDHQTVALAELEKQRALIGTVAVRANPAGAMVHLDGKVIGKTPLDAPIRVTAGSHSIVVLLDGYEAQARELQVAAGARSELDLTLQSHKSAPASTATPTPVVVVSTPGQQTTSATPTVVNVNVPRQQSVATSGHQRTAGYVLGGLGVVVAGVGTYLAVSAFSDARDAKNNSDSEAWNSAKSRSYWGWGTIAAGSVVATTGLVLFATSPSNSATGGLRLSPFSNGYAHGVNAQFVW